MIWLSRWLRRSSALKHATRSESSGYGRPELPFLPAKALRFRWKRRTGLYKSRGGEMAAALVLEADSASRHTVSASATTCRSISHPAFHFIGYWPTNPQGRPKPS